MVAPDVFVIFGVPQRRRRTYKTWEHSGKTPDLVIELTCAGTRYEDLGTKRVLYAELGMQEYYIFDPLGDYLKPQLRGYELTDGELLPLPETRIFSRLLNVELRPEGRLLRLIDVGTGQPLLTPYESEAGRLHEAEARQREAEARQSETEARAAAEAEVARLRAELDRLKSGQ